VNRIGRLALGVLLALSTDASITLAADAPVLMTPDTGRLGEVRRFDPPAKPSDVVLLVSDAAGWDARSDGLARAVAASGRIVLGIDMKAFQAGMDKTDDTCSFPVNDLEEVSHQVQKTSPFDQYRPPVILGVGAGAAVAYASVTESLPTTFAAAVGLDFCPVYLAPRPFCPDAPSAPPPLGGAETAGIHAFGPAPQLETSWFATIKAGCPSHAASAVMDGTAGATPLADDSPLAVTAALDGVAAEASRSGMPDIPVVEIPGDDRVNGGDTLAIFYSGDGGWRDIDRQIGEEIARSGVPVVGVDSLRYFWRERKPEEIARDLDHMISHYTRKWGRPKVLLLGYSFGADIMPFAVNRLSAGSLSRVRLVSLLGFATKADFEVRIGGWLGVDSENAVETLPEVGRMAPVALQCVYGSEEDDTGCTAPELAHAESIRMEGGHHFDGDYQDVAKSILRAAGVTPPKSAPKAK
jgi:type IV secretory pathway VirJ component